MRNVLAVTFDEAQAVALHFRRLVLLIVLQFALGFPLGVIDLEQDSGSPAFAFIGFALFLALCLLWVVFLALLITTYRLMTELGSSAPWLWTLAMLIPCLNILVLLSISSDAQRWCKERRIPVGFFGPTREGLERLKANSVRTQM